MESNGWVMWKMGTWLMTHVQHVQPEVQSPEAALQNGESHRYTFAGAAEQWAANPWGLVMSFAEIGLSKNGVYRYTMIYHDIPWYTMIYHDIPWYTMIYHDIPPTVFVVWDVSPIGMAVLCGFGYAGIIPPFLGKDHTDHRQTSSMVFDSSCDNMSHECPAEVWLGKMVSYEKDI